MRKRLIAAAALCCMFLGNAVFTSCSKDDDNSINGQSATKDTVPVALRTNLNLTVGQDMIDNLNIIVKYYDEQGKLKKDTLEQTGWSKSVKAALPANMCLNMIVTPKDSDALKSLDVFKYECSYGYTCTLLNAANQIVGKTVTYSTNSKLSMKGDKAFEKVSRNDGQLIRIHHIFDQQGNATQPTPVG